ncbi:MAG: MlaD family protein [bacterium]
MERLSIEVKVGIVVVVAIGLVLAFLFLLGDYNPFTNTYNIKVSLDYAGGIKPGSDVHLAGAKVGRVESIHFAKKPEEDRPTMELGLVIDKRAKKLIRRDSTFAVHMESLLGGKIMEISPGSSDSPVLKDEDIVRGEDPPRLDQLLNEGVYLLEQIKAIMEGLSPEDRENLRQILSTLASLRAEDVEEARRALNNLADASEDLSAMSSELKPRVGPLLDDLETTAGQAQPALNEARVLMGDGRELVKKLDRTVTDLKGFMPEDKKKVREKTERLLEASEDLAQVADRLDRFTARMEEEFEGTTRKDVERILREFFQQEGITVNVGSVVGKPPYPTPPEKTKGTDTGDKQAAPGEE